MDEQRKKNTQTTGSNSKQEETIIICIQEVIHDEKQKQIYKTSKQFY